MFLFVGDLHGRIQDVVAVDQHAIQLDVQAVIQVGDFGLSFSRGKTDSVYRYFDKRRRQRRSTIPWYTCGGNHDHWPLWRTWQPQKEELTWRLAGDCFFADRGSVVRIAGTTFLFCGGAESTDKHRRAEGRDWWSEETPNHEEFTRFHEQMELSKPDVVVTHDAPLCVSYERDKRDVSPTPRNLQAALDASEHKPKLWVYGHHHEMRDETINGVRFVGCGLHGQGWNSEAAEFFSVGSKGAWL